jgi:hypothetical protein
MKKLLGMLGDKVGRGSVGRGGVGVGGPWKGRSCGQRVPRPIWRRRHAVAGPGRRHGVRPDRPWPGQGRQEAKFAVPLGEAATPGTPRHTSKGPRSPTRTRSPGAARFWRSGPRRGPEVQAGRGLVLTVGGHGQWVAICDPGFGLHVAGGVGHFLMWCFSSRPASQPAPQLQATDPGSR